MSYADQPTLEFIEALEQKPGYALMAFLDKKWFNEGQRAALNDKPIDTLWNETQRRGYRFFRRMQEQTLGVTLNEARKLHQLHRRSQLRRRVAGVVVAIALFVLAAGSAEASVYLALIKTPPVISASPPECFECYRAYLPTVEVMR